MISSKLEQHLSGSLSISVGQAFSTGWDIFKKGLGQFVVYTIVYLVLSFIGNMIPFLNFLVALLISPILSAGFFFFADDVRAGREQKFERFFAGFSKFSPIVVSGIIAIVAAIALIMIGALIAFGPAVAGSISAMGDDPDAIRSMFTSVSFGMVFLIMLIPVILAMLVSYCNYMAVVGIITLDLSLGEAWNVAFKIVAKNILPLLLFTLLSALIALLGLLLLGIGLLFAIPLIMTIIYAMYYHTILEHVQENDMPVEPILER